MRSMSIAAGAIFALMTTSCGGGSGGLGPTAQDIDNSLNDVLRSVAGGWTGVGSGSSAVRLDFTLTEISGQVSGTGTFKADSTAAAVPITITGTYQRPVLTLAIDGIVYESRPVKGAMQGSYTTVGGIAAPLKLSATDYSRDVAILWQEK